MKFQPTPPREKIYHFQKCLKIIISFFLFVLAMWQLYSGFHLFLTDHKRHLADGLFSIIFSIIIFGLSVFLYQNRSNNTPRYEGFEP